MSEWYTHSDGGTCNIFLLMISYATISIISIDDYTC
jgi:hypothetical protein